MSETYINMKKKPITLLSLLFAAIFFCCLSCEQEEIRIDEEPEMVEVEMVFGVEKYRDVVQGSRSGEVTEDTQSGITVTYLAGDVETKAGNEERIDYVYVFQFENTSTDNVDRLLAKKAISLAEMTQTVDSEGAIVYKAKVELVKKNNCHIFIAVNESSATFYNAFTVSTSTVKQYKDREQVLSPTTLSEVTKGNTSIPMSGYYAGAIPTPNLTVWLHRLYAKITLSSVNLVGGGNVGGLSLTAISVHNITDRYKYVDAGRYTGGIYPATSYIKAQLYHDITTGALTFYMPENRRGVNSSVLHQKDKYEKNDLSWDGTNCHATYIELNGRMWIDRDQYKYTVVLFPGENITSDYNIKANTYYHISVTLQKFDDDDNRIAKFPYVV